MGAFVHRVFVMFTVLILLSEMYQIGARRRRLCKLKKKKGECIDIIPRKTFRRYKHCPDYNLAKEGNCAKVNGTCRSFETARGRTICECFHPGRLFKDQPANMDILQ